MTENEPPERPEVHADTPWEERYYIDQERFDALDSGQKETFLTEMRRGVERGLTDEEAMEAAFQEVGAPRPQGSDWAPDES